MAIRTRSPRLALPRWVVILILCSTTTAPVLAHGTIITPPSRVYLCRFADTPENPQDPACAAAVDFVGGPQFLYDWAGIRQGDANGQHQAVVPDGEHCSGGDATFAGLDLVRGDWRPTTITDRGDGFFEFVYLASAPHSTRDMLFYVTQDGWQPTDPLTWESLDLNDEPGNPTDPVDPFCHLTNVTLEAVPGGQGYRMICPMPQRTGRHVIYNVWQRDDSGEAFYACIDVVIEAPGTIFTDGFEADNLDAWSVPAP